MPADYKTSKGKASQKTRENKERNKGTVMWDSKKMGTYRKGMEKIMPNEKKTS